MHAPREGLYQIDKRIVKVHFFFVKLRPHGSEGFKRHRLSALLIIKCSRSLGAFPFFFRFSTTFHLENGWSQSETDENVGLGVVTRCV